MRSSSGRGWGGRVTPATLDQDRVDRYPTGGRGPRSRTLKRRCRLSSVGQSDALVMRRSRVRFPEAAQDKGPGPDGPGFSATPAEPNRGTACERIGSDSFRCQRGGRGSGGSTVQRALERRLHPLLSVLPLCLFGAVLLVDFGALVSGYRLFAEISYWVLAASLA